MVNRSARIFFVISLILFSDAVDAVPDICRQILHLNKERMSGKWNKEKTGDKKKS